MNLGEVKVFFNFNPLWAWHYVYSLGNTKEKHEIASTQVKMSRRLLANNTRKDTVK